jgi:cytochrome b subunit of formate dehydrogenase
MAQYFIRFTLGQRLLHGFMMLTFLGLVATGMPLRYAQAPWAVWISHALGGFRVMGFFHRFFALFLTGCFLFHLGHIAYRAWARREKGLFWGPDSIVPQPRDFKEFYQSVKWFFGLGPRPIFGRFTYWEKFDYWAVFWGMAIIGTSGYVLWFHTFFSKLFPGWIFNIVFLFHGDEALLAAGFIFTIHFFNSHLRPEKFPMDMVIFTGIVSETELKQERPAEYEHLLKSGTLESLRADPPAPWLQHLARSIGAITVGIGLLLFFLILFAVLMGERN